MKKAKRKLVGRDPVSQLYRAIIRYVESKGGKIIVIGGIEIQEWPLDPKLNFRVGVRCLGRKPVIEPKEVTDRGRKEGDVTIEQVFVVSTGTLPRKDYCPGCGQSMLYRQTRNAIELFCSNSDCPRWLETFATEFAEPPELTDRGPRRKGREGA